MPRLSVLFLLPLLIVSPAMAQNRMELQVAALCLAPPMEAGALDRLRRGADFAELLDGLAVQCPMIAMLFAEWVIGEVDEPLDGTRQRNPPDFLSNLGPDRIFARIASIPAY